MAKGILEASLEERAAKMMRPFAAKEAAGTETHRWSVGTCSDVTRDCFLVSGSRVGRAEMLRGCSQPVGLGL